MAVASYFDTVQKLYIAFYQRPADPSGLYYWAQRMDVAGGSLEGMIDAFASSDEAVRLYDTNTDGKIDAADTSVLLDKVFQALFNRAPDAAGKQFYLDALTAGKFPDGRPATIGRVVLDVLNGANNADAVAVANKLEYATAFTKTLDPELDGIGPFTATYNGDDEAGARTLLAGVTADPTTRKTAAQVAGDVQTQIANAGDPILNQQTTGQTFTLTTGVDIKTGGAGNDTFDGSVNANGTATLTSVDQLDGAGGSDTLIAGMAGGNIATKLSNIESAELITSAVTTFDLINITGLNSLLMRNSSAALTVNNIGSTSATTITAQDQAADFNLNFANAALAGANTFTLNLSGAQSDGSGGAAVAIAQQAGGDTTGLETLTLTSGGSGTNFLDAVTVRNAAATSTLATLQVTGAQGLTVANNFEASARTIDASGMTGTTGLNAGFAATAAVTVTGSGGNDTLTFAANNANSTIAAGGGNDVISIANFDANDSIAGGDGTADRLDISAANAEGVTANLANLTGFEQLSLNTATTAAASVNATRFGAIDTVRLDRGMGAGNFGLTAGAGTVTVGVGNGANGVLTANTLTVTDTGTATTDVLNLTNRRSTDVDVLGGATVVSAGYETVNINTGATAVVTVQTLDSITINSDSLSSAVTLNVTGANSLTLDDNGNASTVNSNSSGLLTIDASGLTGTAAFIMTEGVSFSVATGTISIKGSANNDTLRSTAASAATIDGGAGRDTIVTGSAADSILGGAGNDTITAGGGNDTVLAGDGDDTIDVSTAGKVSVDGGAGNDVVNVAATLSATDIDTIAGGEGTDTLQLGAQATAASASGISGFETLSIDAAFNQGLEQFTSNPGFTRINYNVSGNVAITNASASVDTIQVDSTGANAFSLTRLVDTTANALTVLPEDLVGGLVTVATLTANDEETLTINTGTAADATANNGTGNALTITTLNASDLTTLTVSGANAVEITNAIGGAANLATVNASGLTAAFTANASTSTANLTFTGSFAASNIFTGGTGADSLTGGTAADTITGGNGGDTILGGAGADVLNGGLGADSILGEIGNDTITGGVGNDTLVGGDGADDFVFEATSNGVDTITGFVSGTDDLIVSNLITAPNANEVVITAAGAIQAITDDRAYIVSFNGAAANLTNDIDPGVGVTAGSATLSAADMTATTLTNLATYLSERFTTVANDNVVFAINWTAGGSTTTYVYNFVESGTAQAGQNDDIAAGELTLVGIVDRGTTALVAGDLNA